MKRENGIWERLACMADLRVETQPGMPLAELVGLHRVLIENHRGVSVYSPEEIQISVSYGSIIVFGEQLELACMTGEQLVITGDIKGIQVRKGRP